MQSAVEISDVTFRNVYGTSVDEIAVDLVCSDHIGCTNIVLNDIDIKSAIRGSRLFLATTMLMDQPCHSALLLFHAYLTDFELMIVVATCCLPDKARNQGPAKI